MDTSLRVLAVLGAAAVAWRLVGALFRVLRRSVEAVAAGGVADTRAGRGDLTGMADARAVADSFRGASASAIAAALLWLVMLLAPLFTTWPHAVYAAYAVLWLLPRPLPTWRGRDGASGTPPHP